MIPLPSTSLEILLAVESPSETHYETAVQTNHDLLRTQESLKAAQAQLIARSGDF